ncbi:MAG TPA: M23 family metallopeptidase [Anaerolineales bacterium]|nr:M23 family metallopeptidase [Anaerolineales bacterium]
MLLFLFSFFLAACAPAQQVAALPDATATTIRLPESTATFISPSPTPSPTQIPCDPRVEDYCITDGHLILHRPITPPGNDSVDVTYRYASTENGKREPHHGVEFLNKFGTPVQSAANGTVIFAGPDSEAVYGPSINFYGNLVVIQHQNAIFTLYGHLSKIHVQAGDVVYVGEQIGEVGQSGVATGSHLHFEVRRGDVKNYFATQNPELWLIPRADERNVRYGVVMVSIVDEESRHQYVEMTLERRPTASDKGKTFYLDAYVNEMATGEENAAMGDLIPGSYRIALKLNGHLYERSVAVKSGKLTQVVIVVK